MRDYQLVSNPDGVAALDRAYQCRVLVRLLATPGERPSLQDLADETGLQAKTIQTLLVDPELEKVRIDTCKEEVAGIMLKTLHRMNDILDNPESSPTAVVNAGNLAVTIYKAIDKTNQALEGAELLVNKHAELMRKARAMNVGGRIKVEEA